ncbi:hypothetical protein [Pseudohongiella spirulinae]|uniref:Guanylate cyclase domain-containing protein n=1 Tax=Pseudohongiella spirulinae TaxID=1249552 RepID=A0A0S2KAA4_9GAMM|nr:hypothetical protein [Pseudohongiella spirulinae]ALO44914.1 hypothetical protein PS2015_221 [Pseudohongiella spirulinae]
MKHESGEKIQYTKRWFAYFDLLGFSDLVQQKSISQIMPLYNKALDQLERSPEEKKQQGIYVSWFSDTFIVYSRGSKAEDFANIEHVSRLFFQHLILNKIAVRGALTFGELYSQQEKNIFVGPALIDAYRYGEGVNWLGFILTPNAINRLEEVSLPARERNFYRGVTDETLFKPGIKGPISAFSFNNGLVQGKNPYLKALSEMRAQADPKFQEKYDNTISFIQKYA